MNRRWRKDKTEYDHLMPVIARKAHIEDNACLRQFYSRVLLLTICSYLTYNIFLWRQYGYYPAPIQDPIDFDITVNIITATWRNERTANAEEVLEQLCTSLPKEKCKIHPAVRATNTVKSPGPSLLSPYEFGHINGMIAPWLRQNSGKFGLQISNLQIMHKWYIDILDNGNRPLEEYILIILEDDIKISADFLDKVKTELSALPSSWDSVNMGMCLHENIAFRLWNDRLATWIPPHVLDMFSNTHAMAWSFKGIQNLLSNLPINVYAWDMFNAWLIFDSRLESYNFCPAIATFMCPSGGDCKKKKDYSNSVIEDENKKIMEESNGKLEASLYKSGRDAFPYPFRRFVAVRIALCTFSVLLLNCTLRRIKRKLYVLLLLYKVGVRASSGGTYEIGQHDVQTHNQLTSSSHDEHL